MGKRLFENLINNTIDDKKYNLENIYIGNIAKRVISKNGAVCFAQIIDPQLLILEYKYKDLYRDIENNILYPLNFRDNLNVESYYIPERCLYQNTQYFRDLLDSKHISIKSEIDIKQIRELVDELQQKYENIF